MDKPSFDRAIMEMKAHLKIISWLSDLATPYQPDVITHIEQVAHLSEQLAEDAFNLAAEMRNDSIKKAGQAGMVVGMMIANVGNQKEK